MGKKPRGAQKKTEKSCVIARGKKTKIEDFKQIIKVIMEYKVIS